MRCAFLHLLHHSNEVHNRYEKVFSSTIRCAVGLMLLGLLMDSPKDILYGLYKIVTMQDLLITDYISIAGPGAAFFNAGIVTIISIFIIRLAGEPYNGHTVVEMGLMAGFSLLGKKFLNI